MLFCLCHENSVTRQACLYPSLLTTQTYVEPHSVCVKLTSGCFVSHYLQSLCPAAFPKDHKCFN